MPARSAWATPVSSASAPTPPPILPTHFGWHPLLALLAGALAAGLLAAIVARPIFRLKGHYLAMATLGLGIIINIVLRNEAT